MDTTYSATLRYYMIIHSTGRNNMWRTNKYSLWNSFQRVLSKMYAIKDKMVLVSKKHQQVIFVTKYTMVHTRLCVFVVKCVYDIPRCVCNRNQARKDLKGYHICQTEYDHDCIIYWIGCRDKI